MKILILTPLFPPDTASSAQYSKELAARLSQTHQVAILLYGHLPEEVPEVQLFTVDKRKSILVRAVTFTKRLLDIGQQQNLIIVQNGPSVELPSLLTLWLIKKPIIIMESDPNALLRTNSNLLSRLIYKLLCRYSSDIVKTTDTSWPVTRPTINPLLPFPDTEMKKYETSWDNHLQLLQSILKPS